MPDDGRNPYIYPAHSHFLLPLCASQTDRVETDREHGEPDLSYVLAAAGRALPRAAGSRSVFDAAELRRAWVWVGGYGWVCGRRTGARHFCLWRMSCMSACRRVGVSADIG